MRTLVSSLLLLLLAAPPAALAGEVTIKLGTVAPDGSPWHRKLKELAERWDKDSGGQVKLKIYPGGVAGDESDMIRKMRVGQMQAAALTSVGLHDVDPALQGMITPGLFRTDEEFQCVVEKMSPTYTKRLADAGFVVLAWGDTGWVHFFMKKEARTPAAAKGFKMFTWAGDPGVTEAWRRSGFQPVVLSINDLTTSLATGMVDTFNASPILAFTTRWYERTPYMLDYPWARVAGAILVTQASWDKVPSDLKPKLLASAKELGGDINQAVARMGQSAVAAMVKNGLTVIKPTEDEAKQWTVLAENTWPMLRGPVIPAVAFDQIKKARDECRAVKK